MRDRYHYLCLPLLASLAIFASCSESGTALPLAANVADAGPRVVDAATTPDAPLADGGVTGPFGDVVPVTGTESLAGLLGPVDVVRDKNGMVHIYATSAVDAMRVEGYQIASDRNVQLELFRRTAEGSIAEIAGASAIDSDIAMRALGIKRVGQAMYDALPSNSPARATLDAYADGISQWNARVVAGTQKLPAAEMFGVPTSALGPWTGADVLAVGRFEEFSLSYFGADELYSTSFVEASRATFNASATNSSYAARAGFLVDAVRFDTLDPTTILSAFPNDAPLTGLSPSKLQTRPTLRTPRIDRAALAALEPVRQALVRVKSLLGIPGAIGSNDWVVGPSMTATGHTMVASDPHLSLSAPAVFWMVHLNVTSTDPTQQLDCAGMAFPGIPGVILGFNQHVGWGATDAYYDVSDTFQETVTSDGKGVVINGQPVPFQTATEVIPLGNGQTYTYDVQLVPNHGPILPTIDESTHTVIPAPAGGTAMSERWTGLDVTNDTDFILGIIRATGVEDFRTAVRTFATGAENWAVGDDQGNVFYTSQANIPKRDKRAFTWDPATFTGTLPYFVLPGDGTAEWQGYLEEQYVPHKKNPTAGFIATANNQQVPRPAANDPSSLVLPTGAPMFLGAEYTEGNRAGRVTDRLESMISDGHKMSLDDMAGVQADVRSPFGAAVSPYLLTALQHAAQEKASPGTHPDLTAIVADPRYAMLPPDLTSSLQAWGKAGYEAISGVDPTTNLVVADPTGAAEATAIFNVWFSRMLGAVFADELGAISQVDLPLNPPYALAYLLTADPTKLATYDAVVGDSILFDDLTTTSVVESRDERAILSILDAVDFLHKTLGADSTQWRWGAMHTLRFTSVVSFWTPLSIPPGGDKTFPNGFPRHGDLTTVDPGDYSLSSTAPLAAANFGYSNGPVQRFVIDLDPTGPVARNVLPGGEIWDNTSPHFRDEAEYWRNNENLPVPFAKADVVSAAESHVVYTHP